MPQSNNWLVFMSVRVNKCFIFLYFVFCSYLVRSLPEKGLTERAIGLVGGVKPLANATDMELVVAVFAGESGQRSVSAMEDAVTNAAFLHA